MAKDEKKEKEEKVDGVITAVYKVNLHCRPCAREIQKPLMRTEGVHKVDFNMESNEIHVKGMIDVKKIHARIENLSKKKVEIVSPKGKIKETSVVTEKKEVVAKEVSIKDGPATEKIVKDTKEKTTSRTISVKVNMHCDKCELDLRKRLIKHKGIYSVKTDMKAQTLTVEGSIESEKLIQYIRKKVHRHAEIITPKAEKKEKAKVEVKSSEVKIEAKSTEFTKIVEFKEEMKVDAKDKDGQVPYFVHYVYAPQLFSDENPNACSVM